MSELMSLKTIQDAHLEAIVAQMKEQTRILAEIEKHLRGLTVFTHEVR